MKPDVSSKMIQNLWKHTALIQLVNRTFEMNAWKLYAMYPLASFKMSVCFPVSCCFTGPLLCSIFWQKPALVSKPHESAGMGPHTENFMLHRVTLESLPAHWLGSGTRAAQNCCLKTRTACNPQPSTKSTFSVSPNHTIHAHISEPAQRHYLAAETQETLSPEGKVW